MSFSNEDKALIKCLNQFKGYGSRKLLSVSGDKWSKWGFNSLLKKIRETEDTGAANRSMHILKRTWPLTTVHKLVLSQEDQPQTHRSTRHVSRDRSNTIHCCTDHLLPSLSELSEVSEKSLCARTNCSYC